MPLRERGEIAFSSSLFPRFGEPLFVCLTIVFKHGTSNRLTIFNPPCNVPRHLILPQPNKPRMPHVTIRCPFAELDLGGRQRAEGFGLHEECETEPFVLFSVASYLINLVARASTSGGIV